MGKKQYLCVLDTETVTSLRKVFDLGYKIIDRSGSIYETGSFIAAEQIADAAQVRELTTDNFSKGKCHLYFNGLLNDSDEWQVVPFATIREIVNQVISKYDAILCAYNIAFDINALNRTSRIYCGTDFFDTMPELCDIWACALSTVCATQKFIKFIADNSFVTGSGNPQTGAEAVYRYLMNDTTFNERHTALADCDIEAEIFAACVRTHKKMSRDTVGMCVHNSYWQDIVARYHEYTQN